MDGEGIYGTDIGQSVENQKKLYQARPFLSHQSDLDVDFDEKLRPILITRLLSSCIYRTGSTKFSGQEIWHWSLKERLQSLIAVGIATLGKHLKLQVNCSKADCHELMEIDLDLGLFIKNETTIPLFCKPDSETELELRLPNGLDQLNWLNNQYDMEDNCFSGMASSLISKVNGEIPGRDFQMPENWIDQIGVELEQNDDLMTLEINTSCPVCREKQLIDLDLEEKLLEIFLSEQKLLFKQIHKLALAYHWSEADIVTMQSKRRHYYLTLIDEE